MTNFQVYKKTLPFSFLNFFVGILELLLVTGLATIGFFVMNKTTDRALIGLVMGLVLGMLLLIPIHLLVVNRIKAAQIGMMAIGVVDGTLPDNIVSEGFKEVKGRFARITVFFIVTGAIKGIFRQLGRALNKLGTAVGGDTGNAVTSVIDTGIQTVIGYLCDCCLGWVMYNKNKGVGEAACEGAVIFFKHGKTLIRNIGRIFGMGILSIVVIGGAFFGLSYVIFMNFPTMFEDLAKEITEFGTRNDIDIANFIKDPMTLRIVVCAIIGVVFWSLLHSLLIRPFILVGVLRNFMKSGLEEKISDADFDLLASKSPKFQKLRNRAI